MISGRKRIPFGERGTNSEIMKITFESVLSKVQWYDTHYSVSVSQGIAVRIEVLIAILVQTEGGTAQGVP